MKPFLWPVRVYYEDTDAGGVVYYANYLRFMERARTEWLRGLGFEQPQLASEFNVIFVVRSVAIDYLRPSLFNDRLQVSVEVAKVGVSQLAMRQTVLRDGEEVAVAQVGLVCVNVKTFKPVRIPRAMFEKIGTIT